MSSSFSSSAIIASRLTACQHKQSSIHPIMVTVSRLMYADLAVRCPSTASFTVSAKRSGVPHPRWGWPHRGQRTGCASWYVPLSYARWLEYSSLLQAVWRSIEYCLACFDVQRPQRCPPRRGFIHAAHIRSVCVSFSLVCTRMLVADVHLQAKP